MTKGLNDTQIMTLALSIVIPIVGAIAALIHSNSRISDARGEIVTTRDALRAEMSANDKTLRAEMALGFERVYGRFDRLEMALKVHELEHHSK